MEGWEMGVRPTSMRMIEVEGSCERIRERR